MKRFLKNILLFMIIPTISIILIDCWLRPLNNIYKEKMTGLENAKDSIEILILGNSHAAYGVDPNQFTQYAYNLANVNQSLYFDKRLTLKYINEMPRLKYVLISLDYHSLYFSSQGNRDSWSYLGNGIKYKEKSYFWENASPFLFGYTPIVSATIIGRNIKKKLQYHGVKVIDFDVEEGVNVLDTIKHGFFALNGHDDSKFNNDAYEKRLNDFGWCNEGEEHQYVLSDLEDFIKQLQAKGITIILFATPTYNEYNKFYKSNIIKQNKTDIDYLCKKYNIPYWNYIDSRNFDINDFRNCDHLNKEGTVKFSKILNNRLIESY